MLAENCHEMKGSARGAEYVGPKAFHNSVLQRLTGSTLLVFRDRGQDFQYLSCLGSAPVYGLGFHVSVCKGG